MGVAAQALGGRRQARGTPGILGCQRQFGQVLDAAQPRPAHVQVIKIGQRTAQQGQRHRPLAGPQRQPAQGPAGMGRATPVASRRAHGQGALVVLPGRSSLAGFGLNIAQRQFRLALGLGVLEVARNRQRRLQVAACVVKIAQMCLHFAQLHQGDGLADPVAAGAEHADRFGSGHPGAVDIAAAQQRDGQCGQRGRHLHRRSGVAPELQAALQHIQRLGQLALGQGQRGADVQGVGLRHRHRLHVSLGQHRPHHGAALASAAAHDPEVLQGHRHLQCDQGVHAAARPLGRGHRGTQVVLLQVQAVQPGPLLRALHAVPALLGQRKIMPGMPRCSAGRVPGVATDEFAVRVLAQRVKHPVPGRCVLCTAQHQRLVHQRTQQVEDVQAVERRVGAHALGRSQVEAANEHAQALEQQLLGLRQQVVRPIDQRTQGLLALLQHPAATGKQLVAVIQALVDVGHRQRAHARCGQFQRQRDALQALHQIGHRRGLGRRQQPTRFVRLRTLDKQAHRSRGLQLGQACTPRRHGQRMHRVDLLAGHVQGLAAGRHQPHTGRGPHQGMRQAGRGLDQVLAVVEHQQGPPRGQVAAQGLQQIAARLFAQPQHLGGLTGHQGAVAQR